MAWRLALLASIFASAVWAQGAPRLEGFPSESGATERTTEAAAGDNVTVIGTNFGDRDKITAFLGEVKLNVTHTEVDRVILSIPADVKVGSYDLKVVNFGGESNKLKLKIIPIENRNKRASDSEDPAASLTLKNGSVVISGATPAIRAEGITELPEGCELTGELIFYDEIVGRGAFKVANNQTFVVEFPLQAGIKLRPGHYTIKVQFSFKKQRSKVQKAIEAKHGAKISSLQSLQAQTLVTFQSDLVSAAEEADKSHYKDLIESLEKAAKRLDAAYASALRIKGQKEGGFDEIYWWKWVRSQTECVPAGLTDEQREALKKEWLADERFAKGRTDVRFDKDAWRNWVDATFRGETEGGLAELAKKHENHVGTYTYPAYPDCKAKAYEAISLLGSRSAKYSRDLYQIAGMQASTEDAAGKSHIPGMPGQSSDTSRSTLEDLIRHMKRKLRLN